MELTELAGMGHKGQGLLALDYRGVMERKAVGERAVSRGDGGHAPYTRRLEPESFGETAFYSDNVSVHTNPRTELKRNEKGSRSIMMSLPGCQEVTVRCLKRRE